MAVLNSLKQRWAEGWKIPKEVKARCPANCAECPVFKSIDVYNESRGGRVMRVRNYLFDAALGSYEFRKSFDRALPTSVIKLTQQALALFDGRDVVVDENCAGPHITYTGKDMNPEYECLGVVHLTSRAERFGLE